MVLALTRLETYIFKCYCRNQAPNPRIQQTMTTKFKLLFASLAFAGITTLSAQTVGYITRTVNPSSQNIFSLTFDVEPSSFVGVTSGVITSVASNSLTVTGAGWTTNFATTALPYFVKITSGTAKGAVYRVATANNTATTLNLTSINTNTPNINTRGINAGVDTFKIIEGKTLKTLFTGLDVFGTTSSATADVIYINNTGSYESYFYNTSVSQWRPTSGAPVSADNVVINPQAGFIYLRRGNTALNLIFAGTVPTDDLNVPVNNTGNTMVSGTFPIDTTLGALNIQNTPGWVSHSGSVTKPNADKVFIYTTSWAGYVFDSVDNRWEPTGPNIPANAAVVSAGSPVLLVKVGATAGAAIATRTTPY